MHRLIRYEADRARSWYATGLRLMPLLDWRSAACAGAMAGIYLRLLGHLAATPDVVLERRMSLPGQEKILVAVAALAGRTPRPPRPGVTPAAPPVLAGPPGGPVRRTVLGGTGRRARPSGPAESAP